MPPRSKVAGATFCELGFGVAEYRAYAIGSDGHIVGWKPLICEDDKEAIDKAGEGLEGRAVELWCGERFIARFPAES